MILLSAVGLVLIWHRGPYQVQRFYLAALLAALSPLGFLITLTVQRLFGGALSDPNGIAPARLRLLGSVRSIDLNLAAVIGALLSLLAIIWIFQS